VRDSSTEILLLTLLNFQHSQPLNTVNAVSSTPITPTTRPAISPSLPPWLPSVDLLSSAWQIGVPYTSFMKCALCGQIIISAVNIAGQRYLLPDVCVAKHRAALPYTLTVGYNVGHRSDKSWYRMNYDECGVKRASWEGQ